jgi:hypothetical protein
MRKKIHRRQEARNREREARSEKEKALNEWAAK